MNLEELLAPLKALTEAHGSKEASPGEPPAKRARLQAALEAEDADLRVIVEGEELKVSSVLLCVGSPVFRQMFRCVPMLERTNKEVTLTGKKLDEFIDFYESMHTSTFRLPLTSPRALYLSRWADEYQVDVLKKHCEDFMIAHWAVDREHLRHGVDHNLHRWTTHCVSRLMFDVPKHLDTLEVLTSEATKDIFKVQVWPKLCSLAGVTMEMPAVSQVKTMWPFLAAAVRSAQKSAAAERKSTASELKWDTLARSATTWPGKLYTAVYVHTGRADTKAQHARDWLSQTSTSAGLPVS